MVAALVVLWPHLAHSEPVSGSVLDGETLEPIRGATVTLVGTGLSAETDEAGVFSFEDATSGPVTVRIDADGYEPTEGELDIPPGGVSSATFVMLRPGAILEVIEMTDSGPRLPTPPGKSELRREELMRLPGARGDAMNSIKSLPGVANLSPGGISPGSAGPGVAVIRGSAPEDSKVTIDGIEIPLLYHFFGLQSIVPTEFINAIEYLPGGFGADEGGATGGVIRIATRTDVILETSGFAEFSFNNVAGFVQGPISRKHNLQFSAGLRRSIVDLLVPAVIPDDASFSFTTAPQYYDGQLRVDWRRDARHRVSVLALGSLDLLALINDYLDPNEPLLQGKWENETSFARVLGTWQYSTTTLNNRLVVAPGFNDSRSEIGSDRYLHFKQRSLDIRDDLLWEPLSQVSVRAGSELRFLNVDAEIKFPLTAQEGAGGVPNFSTSPVVELVDSFPDHSVSGYAIVDLRPVEGLTLTPGLRLDYFDRIGQTTVLPRISVEQKIRSDTTLRAALGNYSRQPRQGESLQSTLLPELATQYVVGGEHAFAPDVKLSISGFYTDRRQLIVQDPVLAEVEPQNAYINHGYGRSYGVETLLRARRDNFFGWLSYTLSRSDRIDAFDRERRLFDFDQTHNFIVVGSYTLGSWEFGGRWQYSTGNPMTPVAGSVYLVDHNIYVPIYGPINSERLSATHQLDLRVDRNWTFRTWNLSVYLDVSNAYMNPRVLGFNYNYDFSQRQAITELPIFPSFGIRGSF